MQTKFKRHQKVKLLTDPEKEYVEYYSDGEVPIEKGAVGKVNVILPNGRYHVEISDANGNVIAYVVMDEESLEDAE